MLASSVSRLNSFSCLLAPALSAGLCDIEDLESLGRIPRTSSDGESVPACGLEYEPKSPFEAGLGLWRVDLKHEYDEWAFAGRVLCRLVGFGYAFRIAVRRSLVSHVAGQGCVLPVRS